MSVISTMPHYRPCKVGERNGLFLCWEQYAYPNPAGQFLSRVFAIVEFEEGVERVEVSQINFVDEEHAGLVALNKYEKEKRND